MSLSFSTPRSLVDALRRRCPLAQTELERRLSGPVEALCRSYLARHPDLVVDVDLIARLLRWIEAHLIRLSETSIGQWGASPDPWRLFCLEMLAAVTRLMLWEPPQANQSHGDDARIRPAVESSGVFILDEAQLRETGVPPSEVRELVQRSGYDVELYFRSRDAVGGDWVIIGPGPDHGFWTIVADFMGKSWIAFVLKKCVCLAWDSQLRRRVEAPSALLQKLHAALLDKLPEGTFVELLAGQFQANGLTEIVSAGMGHLLALDAATATVSAELLSAPFVGLDVGKTAVRQVWQTQFAAGDQVLLSTDGMYDQPLPTGRIGGSLVAAVNAIAPVGDLHGRVVKIVELALQTHHQHDDLTLLTVTRHRGRP